MPEEEESCREIATSPRRTQAAVAGGWHRDPVQGCPLALRRGEPQEALSSGRVGSGFGKEL